MELDGGRTNEGRNLLKRALRIYTDIGIPDADRVRTRIDALGQSGADTDDDQA